MQKHEMLDIMDQEAFLCVNPYDVMENIQLLPAAVTPPVWSVDVPLQDDTHNSTIQRNWAASSGGGFYGPPAGKMQIKLEMEQFGDLSSFFPKTAPKPHSTNCIDELNTPIFNKDAFDFTQYNPMKNDQNEELLLKLEYDAYYDSSESNTNLTKYVSESDNTQYQQPENIISDNGAENVNATFSPEMYQNNVETSPIVYEQTNCAISVNNDSFNKYSYVTTSPNDNQRYQHGFITPEDSNSSTSSGKTSPIEKKGKLQLNVNLQPSATIVSTLSTPEVIEEVADLENADFNILDLVNNEDIRVLNADELFNNFPKSSTFTAKADAKSQIFQEFPQIPKKKPRKRRRPSDEDEDYVPPTKKNIVHCKKIVVDESQESESEEEEEIKLTPKKRQYQKKTRGRPPKRTESISSDCSKDSDVSKYRELRDKNNEASRKSRLKRKELEMDLEKEADELSTRNVKLKTQVEELEKMVTNFRTNLFKIMISK